MHRQLQIIRAVRPVLDDPAFQAIEVPRQRVVSKGGVAYQRQLMFAKVARFHAGRRPGTPLGRSSNSALMIPCSIHFYDHSECAWRLRGRELSSSFFSTKRSWFDQI